MGKIAVVCGSLAKGGAERNTIYLAKYFQSRGLETMIVTGGIADDEYPVPEGVTRYALSESKQGVWDIFGKISRLKKIIRSQNIQLLVIMGVPLCSYVIPGCIGTKVRVIVSERNDPTHFAGKMLTKYISRFLMCFADGFVFQTEDAKKFYHKICKDRGVVIPNPINIQELPDVYEEAPEKCIVSVGRLNPQKNQEGLIRAFSKIAQQYPEYKLVIYGEGELHGYLEQLIQDLNLQHRVLLPGRVSDITNRIRSASLFVLFSDFEGMPNALIEAMAMGLPCISSDCPIGGPRTLIENGENGILLPVRDENQLAMEMIRLISDLDLRKQLGSNALKVRDLFSIEKIGTKWIEYLSEIAE